MVTITSGSLWNYYTDEVNDDTNEDHAARIKINNNKTITGKSFEYQTKLKGSTPNDNNTLDTEVVVPLKYLSNFWRSLDLLSTNCEIKLDLSWSKECIMSEISITPVQVSRARQTIGVTFQINHAKLYVSVVTLSIYDNIKFLENKKQGFKRTISWNKYISEITTQPKNNNLDYLIDATFENINRQFALSFKNGNKYLTRNSFKKYYMPLVKIKELMY